MTWIIDSFGRLVDLLNRYANLLLAIITVAYVWLTWRNAEALREASLREREAQHLQEIKDNVAQPILSWIESTIGHRFTGGSPEILTVEGGFDTVPRQVTHTIDDPFAQMRRLDSTANPDVPDRLTTWTSLQAGRISTFLHNHTKRDHFPDEIRNFDNLLEEIRRLIRDLVSFANQCAKDVTGSEIPTAAHFNDENSMPEVVSPYQLVADCVRSFLEGKMKPDFRHQHIPPFYSFHGAQNNLIAKVTGLEKAERWLNFGSNEVRKRWEQSDLPTRVRHVLTKAEHVRQNMQHILFTHSLQDCELISPRKPSRWLWRRRRTRKPA